MYLILLLTLTTANAAYSNAANTNRQARALLTDRTVSSFERKQDDCLTGCVEFDAEGECVRCQDARVPENGCCRQAEGAEMSLSEACGEGCQTCIRRNDTGTLICVECRDGYRQDEGTFGCISRFQEHDPKPKFNFTTTRELEEVPVRQSFPYGTLLIIPCFIAACFARSRQHPPEETVLARYYSSDEEYIPPPIITASDSEPPAIPSRSLTRTTSNAVVVVGPSGNVDVGFQEKG